MAETTIDELVARSARDGAFRGRMVQDPRGTLAAEGLTVPDDDLALLDEYARVASSMSEAELEAAIAEYLAADADGRARRDVLSAAMEFASAAYWRHKAGVELDRLRRALAGHGYAVDDALTLFEDSTTLFAHYDPDRRGVCLGMPDITVGAGRYRWLMYLRLTGGARIEDAARDADQLLPVILIHEVCHHLRHRHGRMDLTDPWREEHAVNVLAVAFLRTRPGWSLEATRIIPLVDRLRDRCAKLAPVGWAHATHDDLDEVLFHEMQVLDEARYVEAFAAAAEAEVDVLDHMLAAGLVTAAQVDEARQRQRDGRARYNAVYGQDFLVSATLAFTQLAVELRDPDLPPLPVALVTYLGPPV